MHVVRHIKAVNRFGNALIIFDVKDMVLKLKLTMGDKLRVQ